MKHYILGVRWGRIDKEGWENNLFFGEVQDGEDIGNRLALAQKDDPREWRVYLYSTRKQRDELSDSIIERIRKEK